MKRTISLVLAVLTALTLCAPALAADGPAAEDLTIIQAPAAEFDEIEPAADDTSATPAPDGTPAPDETPAPDGTPAPDETPVPEDTPVPTATPKPSPTPKPTLLVKEADGKTYYYLNGEKMKNTLVQDYDGKMYYCAEDGHIMKGGIKEVRKGCFYYLDKTDGHVLKGGWISGSGTKRFYAGKDGMLYTGFQTIGKQSFYFSVQDAHMMRSGVVTGLNDQKYYVAKDGHALKNGWARGQAVKAKPGYSNYYYLDETGVVRKTQQLPTNTKIGSIEIPKL